MKKRILSLFLTLCTLISLSVPAFAADSEESVIQTVKALGIMRGDQYGNMNLDREISRAEFAKMLISASSFKDTISDEGSGFSVFSDVKSNHWASEYIRQVVAQKWMVGYTDGSFRPDKTITLEEACTAILRVLSYDSAQLAGSFPYAQLNKAEALGLRDMVSATRGKIITRRDCMYLFYNMLTAKNANGQVYATTLGYNVVNDKVDYMSVITEGISGPYVSNGSTPGLPFDTTYATVYRDGKASSLSSIAQYDVYYYNADMKTVWIYTDRVSGTISALAPSASSPTSITIGGKDYKIETPTAQYKLSALSGVKTGDVITILLGMNGTVVDALSGNEVDTVYYGIVQASSKELSDDNNAYVQTKVTVACTNGSVQNFVVDKEVDYTVGKLVSVSVSGGKVKINTIGDKTLSGTVNNTATKLGSKEFAEDIQIIDVSDEGDFAAVEAERLAGCTLSSSAIRFYAVNSKGQISHLILDDATGDTWTYGYLTQVTNIEGMGGNVTTTYSYIANGAPKTLRNSTIKFAVTNGGVAIRYNVDGSVKNMKNIAYTKLIDLNAVTARADNKSYAVHDKVQIYLKQDDNYYLTDINSINAEDYNLVGIYDNFQAPAGGVIRIIIATAK